MSRLSLLLALAVLGPGIRAAEPFATRIAEGRKFWSFQPLTPRSLPAVRDSAWPQRRLDAFVLAEMEKRGLAPSSPAPRRVLTRRVTFDLIGLPPSPEDVEAFVNDNSPDAYERLVERLLTSPRHGERWGRFWLDLARYADVTEQWADTKGQPWLYRDWVVRALNDDLPYGQFVQRQLAADLMPGTEPSDRAALGFLGLSPTYWKELKLAPDIIKTVVAEEWEDRIQTISATFLGLTVACARCHDHKFDPITMRDYNALAGILASTRQVDRPVSAVANGPKVPGIEDASLFVVPDGPHKTKLEYKPGMSQDIAMQMRGNPATMGAVVPRRFLTVLSPESPKSFTQGSGRLELARAIMTEGAPLAARVIVNRVWKHHFGSALVDTTSDFGIQGTRPSHPELLDDLAARFVANGWSLKWLHREIVLSATYRQSSAHDVRKQAVDPDNRWLWRANRRRLEIEAWRDALLATAGNLDATQGGPALELNNLANRRRTLYGVVKRRELNDLLRLNDFPDPTIHCAGRIPTTTPLQQLYTLNSPFSQQQSAALARRLEREAASTEGRVQRAYRLLYGRDATEKQVRFAIEFLGETPDAAAWRQYAQVLLGSNEFLFVD